MMKMGYIYARLITRHPEKEFGYKLPDREMITIEQIYEQIKKI